MASSLDDSSIKDLLYFHGFLPREDLVTLLRKEGDFLVRCSEVEAVAEKNDGDKRNLIISYYNGQRRTTQASTMEGIETVAPQPPGQSFHRKSNVRHVVIHKKERKYFIKEQNGFESVAELITFHTQNEVTIGDFPLKLLHPILRQKWEISHTNVQLLKQLGHGEFGEVRSGKLTLASGKKVDVAVKLMKGTSELSKGKRREMMAEARQMRDLKHPHVVRIYGVAVLDMPLYIVLELVDGSSLDKYLKMNKNLNKLERKKIIMQAAWGVEYIHSKNIVHRDLAARNCLISHDTRKTKISDFGMARPGPAYKMTTPSKVPVRWCAPETIQTVIFTFKSDVWSYGLIVYEIYWEGLPPFEGKNNAEVKTLLLEGVRPIFPEVTSRTLVKFFNEHIWTSESKRATMSEVCEFLEGWSKMSRPKVNEDEEEDDSRQAQADEHEGGSAEQVEQQPANEKQQDTDAEDAEAKGPKTTKKPPSIKKSQPLSAQSDTNGDSSEDTKEKDKVRTRKLKMSKNSKSMRHDKRRAHS